MSTPYIFPTGCLRMLLLFACSCLLPDSAPPPPRDMPCTPQALLVWQDDGPLVVVSFSPCFWYLSLFSFIPIYLCIMRVTKVDVKIIGPIFCLIASLHSTFLLGKPVIQTMHLLISKYRLVFFYLSENIISQGMSITLHGDLSCAAGSGRGAKQRSLLSTRSHQLD